MVKKKSWKKRICLLAAVLVLLAGTGVFIYINDYYHAEEIAFSALESTEDVMVTEGSGVYVFAPETANAGLIFYPGGKVEVEAYAPLMQTFAEKGILCVLLEMPGNLAVLDINAADGVQNQYPEIEKWYMGGHSLGGHSLGGSMAASYLEKHSEEFEGLLLLASYSTADLSGTDLKVLSVLGSEDGVLNREAFDENMTNLPVGYVVETLTGGNHAQFGAYGAQDGDGIPTISREQQMEQTAELFAEQVRQGD